MTLPARIQRVKGDAVQKHFGETIFIYFVCVCLECSASSGSFCPSSPSSYTLFQKIKI